MIDYDINIKMTQIKSELIQNNQKSLFIELYFLLCKIVNTYVFQLKKYIFNTESELPKEKKKTDTEIYIEKYTNEFMNGKWSRIMEPNTNIDKCIYNNEEFGKVLSDENNELEKKWGRRILFENTPRGNIAMVYDIFRQKFDYYCDNIVPYSVLNAVAMKYVTIYRCRDFFIDEFVLGYKSELHNMDEVKPKRYDNKNIYTSKKSSDVVKGLNNPRAPKENKKKNVFVHKGKLNEYHPFMMIDNKKNEMIEESKKNMTFSDFMRQKMGINKSIHIDNDNRNHKNNYIQIYIRKIYICT